LRVGVTILLTEKDKEREIARSSERQERKRGCLVAVHIEAKESRKTNGKKAHVQMIWNNSVERKGTSGGRTDSHVQAFRQKGVLHCRKQTNAKKRKKKNTNEEKKSDGERCKRTLHYLSIPDRSRSSRAQGKERRRALYRNIQGTTKKPMKGKVSMGGGHGVCWGGGGGSLIVGRHTSAL